MKKLKEYFKHKNKAILTVFTIIFIFMNFQLFFMKDKEAEPVEVTYNKFTEMVKIKEVKAVEIDFYSAKFEFTNTEDLKFTTDNPKTQNFKEYLLMNDVKVEEKKGTDGNSPIFSIIQLLLYFGLITFMFRRMMPKSKQEDIKDNIPNVTFDDIAGEKELKNDLKFVIQYLKDPTEYAKMGARMPKGIVLYGPPGTGKTLTAKAIAGTAGVPFFSVSGSDFVEMYVGLGAKRVRNLYAAARKKAPCIVFIDEIDAVGTNRGGHAMNSEKDQTINALLSELDGFDGIEGVITICATNRLEDLDPALIRPGRFDKQLAVPLPEKNDRVEIMKVHGKNKKFADDVNFEEIASMIVGFTGASIEALLNEAAFIAVSNGEHEIKNKHIENAFYKMVMKGDKKENQNTRDKEELRIVAYHEAGHAFATKLYTNDTVSKVTIVSYTSGAGGVTFRTPQEMGLYSKNYIRGVIKTLYAGRASELALLGDDGEITTGASSDIEQATHLIQNYISKFGMTDTIGMINPYKLGIESSAIIFAEASKLSNELYEEVKKDIKDNFETITKIAELLLKNETISESELDVILEK